MDALLASAINVGSVDPVWVYVIGWVCVGSGWGMGRALSIATRERDEQQRHYNEAGFGQKAKLALSEVVFGALAGAFGGFMTAGAVGLLLALAAVIFGVDVHNHCCSR
jgi:hypothetical protein